MPCRRILVLVLLMYLSLDLSTPSLPGVFFFDDDGFFIDTVVEGKSRPRLGTGISVPRVIVVARVGDTGEPDVITRAVIDADARGRDRPRVLPSERSSLAPSSLDEH